MTRTFRALCALTLLLAPTPLLAQSAPDQAKLQQVSERGRLLFEVDRAAWVVTDDMLERASEARGWPAKGWIVEREADGGYVVTFYGDGPDGPVAFFVGRARNGVAIPGQVMPAAARPRLSEDQLRLVRAREAVSKLAERPCTSAPFNVAILPPARTDSTTDVYLLTPQVESSVIPFGGHHLLRVDQSGRIVSRRKFTNSCLNMPKSPPGAGAHALGLMITHLLDPIPTEIHVFSSLSAGMPVYVATNKGKRLWQVNGTRIELLDRNGSRRASD